jgi:hypothetical protein
MSALRQKFCRVFFAPKEHVILAQGATLGGGNPYRGALKERIMRCPFRAKIVLERWFPRVAAWANMRHCVAVKRTLGNFCHKAEIRI